MASMFKRNGIWWAKWYLDGKRMRRSLKTRSVARARAKLVEIEAALEAGRPVDHKRDCAVDDFTVKFLEHIEVEKRAHTRKTLAHEWKHFLAWAQPTRLSDVTTETIIAYKRHRLKLGYQKSTVRSTLLALSSVISVAIGEMHAFEGPNPCKGVELPKPDESLPRFLTVAEIDTVLAQAEAHSRDLHLLFALGVYAGLRKGELISARWSWVEFGGRGRIVVQSGGRFQTKSGKGRSIPLAAKLKAILDPCAGDPEQFIVYPEFPEKPDATATTYRVDFTEAFSTVCKRAGVPWVTPHKLRHTFASQHAQAGTSIYKLKSWLGHASIKTTEIYAHLIPEDDSIDAF